jgi:chromosome segregation ATPase
MKTVLAFLLALFAVSASGSNEVNPNRPVSKVISLLKDMLKQLEKEQETDEEIYDKMACWCETNEKEKTASIKKAQAKIEMLETKIEEDLALSTKLEAEMRELEEEVAKNQKALDEATAIREKELAEFNGEEKELLEAITALKSAVTVLAKHHKSPTAVAETAGLEEEAGGAFLQVPKRNMVSVAVALQRLLTSQTDRLQGVLTHSERRAVSAFIQSPEDYFDAKPTFKQSYAPQSGEIFGILEQMKDAFEKDLSEAQKEEAANQKAYDELKAAKNEQIEAGQAQVDKKYQEKAETDERIANDKQDLEDTEESLAADQKFLELLKEKCSMTDAEWEERQKTRSEEMAAVSKALSIISGDDAHDIFTRTFNKGGASLLQTRSSASGKRQQAASQLLTTAATKLHSQRLAKMALTVRLDAFEKVKKAIDDMIAALTEEQAAEVKHKDFCVAELDENNLQTEKKTMEKQDLEAKIEHLKTTIKTLAEEIETLKKEIAEMKVQMKRAGEDREKENAEFQVTVADQRATQVILKKALVAMEGFYGKQKAALLQQTPEGFNPPAGFDEYKNNESAGGVMGMIQMIIADAKKMEDETVRSEEDAQKAYEAFVIETNSSIEAKEKSIVNKSAEKAKLEEQLVQAEADLDATNTELEELADYAAQLHQSCDFTLKNFDLRQEARMEEMDALRQAKQILNGADFSEFLQMA